MLKQASLRLLSADELALVAGGDSQDEITVTATRYMEDNRISDFHFFGGGGGGGFSFDFSWLTGPRQSHEWFVDIPSADSAEVPEIVVTAPPPPLSRELE